MSDPALRVLHVIPSVASRYGGPSAAVIGMCRAIEANGVRSLILTTDADGASQLKVQYGIPVPFQATTVLFFPRQWSESLKYSRPLARWMKSNIRRFDVVHIHAVFSHSCLAAASISRRERVPYIVRPLGTLDPWSLSQKKYRKHLVWHLLAKKALHQAAAIHYTTQEEKRLVEESLGLERGVVIPLGVESPPLEIRDSELFRRRHTSLGRSPYVLVLSRLHPKKRLELLLRAFAKVTSQRQFEPWRLVIAGDGESGYVSFLRRLVDTHGLTDTVIFPGWLEGQEKLSAIRCAELLALTSCQENFGMCVVESLANSVPVLVTEQVNLAPQILSAQAGWVTSLRGNDLQTALENALGDEVERKQRGLAGRKLVLRCFTWSVVAGELITLYRSILAHPQTNQAVPPSNHERFCTT